MGFTWCGIRLPFIGVRWAATKEVGRLQRTGAIEGDTVDGEWEYRPVQLPGDVSRRTAALRLAVQAEFGGWELSRVRLYPGGVRKVWLRRKRSNRMLPELSI